MTIFGKHKSSTFNMSVAFICLYFVQVTVAYSSYQVNNKIIENEKEKYFQKLEKKKEQAKLMAEYNTKKKVYNILSRYRTGLKEFQLRETARAIHEEGKKYGYDPMFLVALIMTESSFYNWAVSRVGARGLMQLMPVTAREIAHETDLRWEGKKTLYNPMLNVKMGIYYLGKMESEFGNLQLALEAYNNGPRRLSRMLSRGFLPTRYSSKVFGAYEKIKQGRI